MCDSISQIDPVLSHSGTSSSPLPPLPASDLKQFLAYASAADVELSPEAKSLITGYYIFSRRRRGGGGGGMASSSSAFVDAASLAVFPASTISTLTALAVAHAKLRVHYEVSGISDGLGWLSWHWPMLN